ncbi:MAG TPA: diaminopimelate epimerase [Candidatus Limnocylindria bacterium]|nr:diaminopimelate epimerase [Candidatus Limnocylindria bacterium]
MKIPFLKMHGAANDFVVVDHRDAFLTEPLSGLVQRLCDRRRGVGADGVLLIERDPELDFAMRYFNADGEPADYCGNGARCVARFALEHGLGRGGQVRFLTAAGVQTARRTPEGRGIELEFGVVEPPGDPLVVEALERRFTGRLVTPGVPHFVTAVERVEWVPVQEWGSALRHHPRFEPAGANVDFVARLAPGRLAMRTYERGVEAETLACGSGAMASALWAAADGERSPVTVLTAGGDELSVRFRPAGGGYEVTLIGPAESAYEGEWSEPVGQVLSGR